MPDPQRILSKLGTSEGALATRVVEGFSISALTARNNDVTNSLQMTYHNRQGQVALSLTTS